LLEAEMPEKKPGAGKTKTKTEGAIKGGNGRYQFSLAEVKDVPAGTGYSTSHGGVVEGDRMLVGYIHKERGKPIHAPAGTLIYIPANAPHTLVASPDDEDVIFIAIKDLSQGIIGKAVDGTMAGPHFEKGFGPRN
jgi:hypothetical protein